MDFGSSLGGMLGGLFGNSGAPYGDAMKQYQNALQNQGRYQNPFFNAGQQALPQYQQYLQQMQNPQQFINNAMNGYQESPYAKFQQQQGMRTAQNMGSASGLTGSTPLMQQAQQNSQNISSQDMQGYLQNVMNMNGQYGQGLQNLIHGGQQAGDVMSGAWGQHGQNMGQAAYGQRAGQNQDFWNIIGGGMGMMFPGMGGGFGY